MSEITLKEHFDTRLEEMDRRVDLQKVELERRLASMNEFREQLNRQAGTFLTRERSEIEHKLLTDKISTLELWKANLEGQQFRHNAISIVALVISFVMAVLHFVK